MVQRINSTNFFRLATTRYKGPDLYTLDGELLAKKGDIVGEIHLDNIRFQSKCPNTRSIGLWALRQVRQSLPDLAKHICENPVYENIRVFVGLTLLNRAATGLGFNVTTLPSSWSNRKAGAMQRLIMKVYQPSGTSDKKRSEQEPKLIWISKEDLLKKWLVTDKETQIPLDQLETV